MNAIILLHAILSRMSQVIRVLRALLALVRLKKTMSETPSQRLFILDGMALAYRSHFAFITNPIRTSKGVNTSALFGFANTLLSILEHENPTHLVACFDTPVPTERHIIFPEYKATRESMPEDLRAQIPEIIRLLEAFRIPVLRIDGYEADDTIGTLTRLADASGDFESYMVSLDKDLGQLISPTTFLWRPGKRGAEHEVVDEAALFEHWGISRAEQVIDILALMGDSADNIPGIPGIGEKTAKQLISQFDSVEGLLARTNELKGKRRENVENNADVARLSKKLATINRQVPLSVTPQELVLKERNDDELKSILSKFELKSLLVRLYGKQAALAPQESPIPQSDDLFSTLSHPTQEATSEEPFVDDLFSSPQIKDLSQVTHHYVTCDTAERRRDFIEKLKQNTAWSLHVITDGKDPLTAPIIGLSIATASGEATFIPYSEDEGFNDFKDVLASSAEKLGFDLQFDLQVLRRLGIQLETPLFDVMQAHALCQPGLRHRLEDLSESLLSYRMITHEEKSSGKSGKKEETTLSLEEQAEQACEFADLIFQLAPYLKQMLVESGMNELFQKIEMPLVPVIADMEYEGVRVLPEVLEAASSTMGEYIDQLRASVEVIAGHPINLNSPLQLGEFLFGELKLVEKPKKTKRGQYVTDEETLSALASRHPVINDILDYREASKLKSTYLDALPRYISTADGRIHTKFHQLLTATGRLASQDPNLQNIPIRSDQGKFIRQAFVPRSDEYVLLSADYSQIELRIMAALSGDPMMIEAFQENRDIHTETAAKVYGIPRDMVTPDMRRAAKTVNFGIIYGISAFGLSQRLGCSRREASDLIESYFAQFPGVKAYMDKLIAVATEKGYAETLCGRRRYLPDLQSANKNIRSAAERTAINTPIQGTAAEMIKLSMIHTHRLLLGKKSRLILQIHDELLVDLHCDELDLIDSIKAQMLNALPLPHNVPTIVEAKTGDNWLAAH